MSLIVDANKPIPPSLVREEDERSVSFKFRLAPGTKREDLFLAIAGGEVFIMSKVDSSASWSIPSLWNFLMKKEEAGDTCRLNRPNRFEILMIFRWPVAVDPDDIHAAIDDDGVLTLTFKKPNPILFPTVLERAFDHENVTMKWEDAKDSKNGVIDFKAHLPAGTKIEDLMLGIGRGKYLIIGMLQKEEQDGDTSLRQFDGNKCKSFPLPEGVDPFGYSTSMDDAGVLTLTFPKLKPKKKLVSKSKLLAGFARVVPACFMIGCEISDKISSGDDFI